jgi:signal transduction histidine kinase
VRGISFTDSQREAFRLEQHRGTLAYGRVLAWLICATQCYGIYQDIVVMELGLQTLVWRLLALVASLLFIVLSHTSCRHNPPLILGAQIVQIAGIVVAMCGINLVVARLPNAHPSYVYGAVGTLTIGVVGTGIGAAGARRCIGLVYAVPIGLLIVGLIVWTDQSAKEIALLCNTVAIGVTTSLFALVHDHLARREFNMRWLAEQRRTQVEAYAEELEEVNRDLEHFIGVASHELQQPLVTVNWWLDLIKSRLKGKECYSGVIEERMTNATTTVSNMSGLISRLLSYTSLGSDDLLMEDLDLSEIVTETRTALDALLTESHANVVVEELPRVRGDRYLVGQLFRNLLENAVKHAAPDRTPEIRVAARVEGHQCRITVSDNGRGIDPDSSRDIFAPGIRLRTDGQECGTGLGLAICRKTVQLHGGTIGVSPNDQGTTFCFTLPLQP